MYCIKCSRTNYRKNDKTKALQYFAAIEDFAAGMLGDGIKRPSFLQASKRGVNVASHGPDHYLLLVIAYCQA